MAVRLSAVGFLKCYAGENLADGFLNLGDSMFLSSRYLSYGWSRLVRFYDFYYYQVNARVERQAFLVFRYTSCKLRAPFGLNDYFLNPTFFFCLFKLNPVKSLY
jgi:hypothetical protein